MTDKVLPNSSPCFIVYRPKKPVFCAEFQTGLAPFGDNEYYVLSLMFLAAISILS